MIQQGQHQPISCAPIKGVINTAIPATMPLQQEGWSLQRQRRRLAAILAADVAGYSRLMAADEEGTLDRLRKLRAGVIEPNLVQFNGHIVGSAGDSLLIEFASAVDAVQCAVELQEMLSVENAGFADSRCMAFRMGINLGDVLAEDGTIHGDGVNVASRLEKLAEPGTVCIARTVYDQVKAKLEYGYTNLGEHQVHNIAEPVHAYRVKPFKGDDLSRRTPCKELSPSRPEKPSIAVLPFENMSGDPEQRYFSDGLTEDIITELSRFRSWFVIARNSSFQYRDKAVDIRKIAKELGVQYVVEGSVRRLGNRIRITAQLIDAKTGNHLWSERYDRSLEALFELQDEVTRTIVSTLTGRMEHQEIIGSIRRRTSSFAAYDKLLRGIDQVRSYDGDANRAARALFEEAIALDSQFALAHAYISLALLLEHGFENAPATIKDRAVDLALSSVRLDPSESRCHQHLANAYLLRGDFDLALVHFQRMLALNPNDANGICYMGYALSLVGRAQEGVEMIRQAMRLNPFHPDWYWGDLAIVLYDLRRYEDALQAGKHLAHRQKHWIHARMAAAYAQLGHNAEARAQANQVLLLKPEFQISKETLGYRDPDDAEHVLEGMRQAGLPE
jgi:TolB-like protein/class 3 adenylate cyclase/Flp pilus assembly protein TadD